jgi:prepilin-type N-terminal cleavage/methylation domain-containing protein
MKRAAFTLIEILVSLMIFSIVSVAMVGVLLGATNVYRAGESARVAHDSTATVLAQISDDLQRMVPAADGGYFFCKVHPATLEEAGGSMLVSFTIVNPDTSDLQTVVAPGLLASNARQVVTYWVSNDVLHRTVAMSSASDGLASTNLELAITNQYATKTTDLISGCLHFSVDLSVPSLADRPDLSWTGILEPSDKTILYRYTTERDPDPKVIVKPMPEAIRVTLVLAGSTRAGVATARIGTVVRENADGIRFTGVKQVPLGQQAIARMRDSSNRIEWIAYDNAKGGVLSLAGATRPATILRSQTLPDSTGAEIIFGTRYHLVMALPR